MQGIAAIAEAWLTQRREGVVARVVAADGLGPRPAADVLLVDRNGRTGGSLLAGAVQPEVVAAAGELLGSGVIARRLSLVVDSVDATAAGLTCGGRVEILVQRLDAIPRRLWDALAAGRPAALVTALDAGRGRQAAVVVEPGGRLTGTLGESALDTLAQSEAEAALAHTGTSVTTVALGPRPLLVEAWNPVPRLVVVGASDLAVALTRQVELLGWSASTVVTADDAVAAIGALTSADVVVVIEHDPFIATPALATALRVGVGYVGALGSRRTQAVRRTHLADVGVREADIARVHGPTGLDLGARSSAETAVSIVAEVIAVRSGRTGNPLTSTTGRITG